MSLEVAVNTNSLSLVAEELNKTLGSATSRFEGYLSERHNLDLLDQAAEHLKQVAGTLDLLQVPGAALIAREMFQLLQHTGSDKGAEMGDKQLSVLSGAFFVLPRYLEFVASRQADIPLLALAQANELRAVYGAELLLESHFNGDEVKLFTKTSQMQVDTPAATGEALKDTLKRLRHMYQVGLLGILRDADAELHLRLMGRAVQRLAAQVPAGSMQRFWLLAHVLLECFQHGGLEINIMRKRLFTVLDREIRRLAQSAPELSNEVPEIFEREILFLLRISSYRDGVAGRFLSGAHILPLEPSDAQLVELRRQMLGPGFETLASVVGELRGELRNAKDMLEILMQSGITDDEELQPLIATLRQVADVLRVLNLPSLAQLLVQLSESLVTLKDHAQYDTASVFTDVADALLFVESSLEQLDRQNLSQQDLAEVSGERRKEITSGNLLSEATQLVLEESQSGINMAKRAISAYVESGYDITHISNVAKTLDGIRGACELLKKDRVTRVLRASVRFIDDYMKRKNQSDEEKQQLLETLADALISLEYYLSELANRSKPDENTLRIAEESLASLGFSVDAA